MIFSIFVFEHFFSFSIKYKHKIEEDFNFKELYQKEEKQFVDLSFYFHKELQIDIDEDIKKSKKNLTNKNFLTQTDSNTSQKYFYFLMKIFLKNNLSNNSDFFKIDDTIYNEAKKVLKIIEKGPQINYKNQSSVIKKSFEFAVLDFYYEKLNILQ